MRCACEFGYVRVSTARREEHTHTHTQRERERRDKRNCERKKRDGRNPPDDDDDDDDDEMPKYSECIRTRITVFAAAKATTTKQRTLDLLPAPLTDVLQRLILQTREHFLCALGRFDV